MLFTHKTELLYLEHARVRLEDGRVVYDQDREVDPQRYNFPHKNAQVLALGTGTSITQQAVKTLAEEGVVIVFTGDRGMPHLMASVTGYHPNEYAQGYIRRWMNPDERLGMARFLLFARLDFTGCQLDARSPLDEDDLEIFRNKIRTASSIQALMGVEGDEVKNLIYQRYAKRAFPGTHFKREREAAGTHEGHAQVNLMLNHGNNLAYAMAAGALWSIGIPSQFPLIHGQTRHGGLIFDAADLIKDGVVAPWAFEMRGESVRKAMGELRYRLKKSHADAFMIDTMKKLGESTAS